MAQGSSDCGYLLCRAAEEFTKSCQFVVFDFEITVNGVHRGVPWAESVVSWGEKDGDCFAVLPRVGPEPVAPVIVTKHGPPFEGFPVVAAQVVAYAECEM